MLTKRISESLALVRNTLLQNDRIRELLVNDSTTPWSEATPTIEETKPYITLSPIYEFNSMSTQGINCMINLFMSRMDIDDEFITTAAGIECNVIMNRNKWEMDDSRIRPLEIIDEIESAVNGKKFSAAGTFQLNSIEQIVIDKLVVGYSLIFILVDGSTTIKNY